MRLSALDIKKQEFKRGFRGYDEDEVASFLDMLAGQWQELVEDTRRLEEKVRELENKLDHYQKVEGALQEALTTAKHSSKSAAEEAERRSALILDEARLKAESMKKEAAHEKMILKQDADKLRGRRGDIIVRMRSFLSGELAMLEKFEREDPSTLLSQIPKSQLDEIQDASNREVEMANNGATPAPRPGTYSMAEVVAAMNVRDEYDGDPEMGQQMPAETPQQFADPVAVPEQRQPAPVADVSSAPTGAAEPREPREPIPGAVSEPPTTIQASEAVAKEEWVLRSPAVSSEEQATASTGAPAPDDQGVADIDEPYNVSEAEIQKIRRILDNLD